MDARWTRSRKAHGRYEHWLWPLYYPENFEAGCQQCHASDMVTEHAPVLNKAKQLYREKGCIGCHRFQGFDNQDEQLVSARQAITQLENQKQDDRLQIAQLNKKGDTATDNATANRYYTEATNLTVTTSGMDAKIEQLDQRSHNLLQEIKKVGPDLKEVRMKIHKEWIPYWIGAHARFPAHHKNAAVPPAGRRNSGDLRLHLAVGNHRPGTSQADPGNAANGKVLFEERGCEACHSIGEGANHGRRRFRRESLPRRRKGQLRLSGSLDPESANANASLCPFEKKDLGPEDYAKHDLPFVFDLDHSRSPDDGHEMVVQQPTVMPSLRLTVEDARDIASYLMTQKHADASYAAADFMDDPKLKAHGKELIQHYGCAGCHEISGLEDEGRIGTELTNEGSKPIERLDFALLHRRRQAAAFSPTARSPPRGPWYDLKGFFENKLTDPAVFDHGKYKPDPMDRLRMPKPNVTKEDIDALTTFLLGSTDPSLPPEYMYKPPTSARPFKRAGGLSQNTIASAAIKSESGSDSVLMGLPQYQGENKQNLPPVLTSEGARVNPDWLKGFLANPSLSTTDVNRNGVRSLSASAHADVLFVRRRNPHAGAVLPGHVQPAAAVHSAKDGAHHDGGKGNGRHLFTSTAAPCLKCHATGDPNHDKTAIAPNFLFAKDRLQPGWTERWITNPALIAPGTAMPSGLFKRDGDHWVFSGPLPASFNGYTGDQADLLVRYMFAIDARGAARLSWAERLRTRALAAFDGGGAGGAGK